MILVTTKNPLIQLALAVQGHSKSPREELGGKTASQIEGRLHPRSISHSWADVGRRRPPCRRAESREVASQPKAAVLGEEATGPRASARSVMGPVIPRLDTPLRWGRRPWQRHERRLCHRPAGRVRGRTTHRAMVVLRLWEEHRVRCFIREVEDAVIAKRRGTLAGSSSLIFPWTFCC